MKFSQVVTLHDNFKKSTNLQLDKGNESFLKDYILSLSNQENLLQIFNSVKTNQSAFTFTGPYGSGKSSFALFLSELLVPSSKVAHQICVDKINKKISIDPSFFGRQKKRELLSIVASPISPIELLANALGCEETSEAILKAIDKLKNKDDGFILIVDEMGKLLEQTAQKHGSLIYIFQQLAEIANSSNGKFILIGILHQSFTEYASNLNKNLQDEWNKIHGRFTDLVIDTSNEEKLDLIGKTIVSNKKPKGSNGLTDAVVETISKNRPINKENYRCLLATCWPLCPIVSILLGPLSLKNFGQNQRSIFSFLISHEAYGFQNFLTETDFDRDITYSIDSFWNYIKNNFDFILTRSSDSHKWQLAQDVLDRLNAQSTVANIEFQDGATILKFISLVDIFKGNSGLVVTKELIQLACRISDDKVNELIRFLQENSLIREAFDKSGYVLFDGSDFSIELALSDALLEITDIDYTQLNRISAFQPIVAKKHYHDMGSIRWMSLSIIPFRQWNEGIKELQSTFNNSNFGAFVLILPESEADYQIATKMIAEKKHFSLTSPIILGVSSRYEEINNFARELLAIEWIGKNTPSLIGDRVARNEIENRKVYLSQILKGKIYESKKEVEWIANVNLGVLNDLKLNQTCSIYASLIFKESPVLHTEMLNNNKPSANANGALNSLLRKMVLYKNKPRLGIPDNSYPAEWGLLNIVLEKTGIYRKETSSENYYFSHPFQSSNNLSNLWERTDSFLKDKNLVKLKELYQMWAKPPFGIKKGLHSILGLSYLLSKEGNVAVYLKGMYLPEIQDIFVDYLIKESNDIDIKYVDMSDVKISFLQQMQAELSEEFKLFVNAQANTLDLSRKMVSLVNSMNPWVHRTKTLSKTTMRLRDLIKSAKDPNKLIFDDIVNLYKIDVDNLNQPAFLPLINSFHELKDAYINLIHQLGNVLFTALQLNPLLVNIEDLKNRAKAVNQATGDFRIDALATRLENLDPESADDIAGIASLAANKPIHDWIDQDVDRARIEIGALCDGFKKAELYTYLKGKKSNRHTYVILSSLNGVDFQSELSLPEGSGDKVDEIKDKILVAIQSETHGKDTELVKAALLQLGIDFKIKE